MYCNANACACNSICVKQVASARSFSSSSLSEDAFAADSVHSTTTAIMEFMRAKAPMQKYDPKITSSKGSVFTNGDTIELIQLSLVAT